MGDQTYQFKFSGFYFSSLATILRTTNTSQCLFFDLFKEKYMVKSHLFIALYQ